MAPSRSNIVPMQAGVPAVGEQQGNWVWDGCRWVCAPDCDGGFWPPGPPGPPPFFPPPQGQPPWYPGANGGVSFSPPGSPPPNPIRGAFWWDGATLWMFDGAAWEAVGGASGGGTPPSATPPANPSPGQQWFNGTTLYVWDGNAWVPVSQTKTSIQPTAPSAPNPGDLWYDGTQLRIWDGSAWELVGPGATVGPVPTTTLVFSLQQPAELTLAANTWAIMPYNATPTIDTKNGWNAAQSKFTPGQPGFYYIGVRAGTDSGVGGIAILFNDPGTFTGGVSSTSDIIIANGSGVQGGWISASGIAKFNGTTDYFRVWGWSPDGGMFPVGSSPAVVVVALP